MLVNYGECTRVYEYKDMSGRDILARRERRDSLAD
jgi:hypothetical protein